jgi:endonuclease/exonuclease/phosphatase family metal-dependent hydrolase
MRSENTPALRVMSYNIRNGLAPDGINHWDRRNSMCVERLRASAPDIAGMQEAYDFQNAFILANLAGYAMVGVGRDDGKSRGEFAPILYRQERFDLVASGTFWLSETPDVPGSKSWDSTLPRIATWVTLRDRQAGNAELLAINTHFDHRGELARVESAKLLRNFASSSGGAMPVLITGDFNAAPESTAHGILVNDSAGPPVFRDVYATVSARTPGIPHNTFNGFADAPQDTHIDWILCTDHFAIESAAIDRYHDGPLFPSDHFPVIAGLRIR